ncbi:MAG: imidazole glycerol phosphate synthase subunit HisH [Alphaproteobacteria bacterium]|nr:imidazole glycerol phosphate synthase subunit HisH [Alphaproteobacteria bacterium]
MAKETVVIIDYGSGNLRSAAKAFEKVGADLDVKISNLAEDVLAADRLVLPGQGAFGDCMDGLQALPGMVEALNEAVLKKGRPFLGICVGMQLMATRGLENGVHAGLNWIEGEVVPMRPGDKSLKIPHMGWNDLVFPSPGVQDNRHIVLRSIDSSNNFYFVHSFVFQCVYSRHLLAMTEYGGLIPAVVGRENMIGVQFHPEKSQHYGLQLISDFLDWRP